MALTSAPLDNTSSARVSWPRCAAHWSAAHPSFFCTARLCSSGVKRNARRRLESSRELRCLGRSARFSAMMSRSSLGTVRRTILGGILSTRVISTNVPLSYVKVLDIC